MMHPDETVFENKTSGYGLIFLSDFIHNIISKLAVNLICSFQLDQSAIEQAQTYCGLAYSF